jgi:hypothetical protein
MCITSLQYTVQRRRDANLFVVWQPDMMGESTNSSDGGPLDHFILSQISNALYRDVNQLHKTEFKYKLNIFIHTRPVMKSLEDLNVLQQLCFIYFYKVFIYLITLAT